MIADEQINEIRDYYGEKVAYYYVFINFFNMALVIPSVLGVFFFFWHWYEKPEHGKDGKSRPVPIDDWGWTPLYTLSILIWCAFYMQMFIREQNSKAYKWKTSKMSSGDEIRDEFTGTVKKNKFLSDKLGYEVNEVENDWTKRIPAYIWSFCGCFVSKWCFRSDDDSA